MKKEIEKWLYNIIKNHYNEKECKIYIKTYIEDEIGYNYLKNQYIKNRNNMEKNLIKSIEKTKNLEKKKYKNEETNKYNLRTNIN